MIRKHVTMKYLKKILAASVAWGPFFAFCSWLLVELKKKAAKDLGSSFFMSASRSLLLFSCAGVNFPCLDSGVAGLLAFKWSVTSATALKRY